MTLEIENYEYKRYLDNGKPVFVPSKKGRDIGCQIKNAVRKLHSFPDFYFHVKSGGHVAGLHHVRTETFYCRLDIEDFFYSIKKNRVAKALRKIGAPSSELHARWSTVKNPNGSAGYVLPYGFKQSPILASLVLDQSSAGKYLREISKTTKTLVFVDDIILASNSRLGLEAAFQNLVERLSESGFRVNKSKLVSPTECVSAFNCILAQGESFVSNERIRNFRGNSPASQKAFDAYVARVRGLE